MFARFGPQYLNAASLFRKLRWLSGNAQEQIIPMTVTRIKMFLIWNKGTYEVVSKSFRTGRLEREMQMLQLSATRCSYIAIF
jgi:hypothetical protein